MMLWEYRYIILFLGAVLIYILFEWQRAKTVLYALMLQAKRYAKDRILRSGEEQEDWVVQKAIVFLPAPIKLFLTEKILRNLIRMLFRSLKDYVDDGTINGSIK